MTFKTSVSQSVSHSPYRTQVRPLTSCRSATGFIDGIAVVRRRWRRGFKKLTKILENFHRLVQDKAQNVSAAGFHFKTFCVLNTTRPRKMPHMRLSVWHLHNSTWTLHRSRSMNYTPQREMPDVVWNFLPHKREKTSWYNEQYSSNKKPWIIRTEH
jgi:hypothetical protein